MIKSDLACDHASLFWLKPAIFEKFALVIQHPSACLLALKRWLSTTRTATAG